MAKSFKNAIEQTGLGGKGIGGLFNPAGAEESRQEEEKVTSVTGITPVTPDEDEDARQTFVVSTSDLEYLRDYAYEKRVSQKEALHQAIELLRETSGEIPPRPDAVREKEQQRNNKRKK